MATAGLALPILLLMLHLAPPVGGAEHEAMPLLAFMRASVATDPHGTLATWVRVNGSSSPCTWTAESPHSISAACRSLAA
ncbi:hypothetical protein PR202_ga20695 [Eleusine coracana subsp. coracana]|uniref:Leucine-rich repeat-containing N-terminal plant-type domain-containing protein n=1 Tax=Eleusine coracana subsp. coracana TaxID=191504 RepID=A0AAV5CXB6_ELECO|nr:hypothetical protein PR202_ga20695 [Eleusine coracana subsp. coracana]